MSGRNDGPHCGVRCPVCSDAIFSEHVHDFRYCKCGEVFVDGGKEYLRYSATRSGLWPDVVKRHGSKIRLVRKGKRAGG